QQSGGSDGPTCHTPPLRIGDHSHHNGQSCAYRGDHVPHPIDCVKYRSFRLSSGLSLNCLSCGRLLPEVLGIRRQRHKLKRNDDEETGKSQALPPITPTENPHSSSSPA